MMMIQGTTTEHSVSADTNAAGGGPGLTGNFVWTYQSAQSQFILAQGSKTALNSATTGPWTIVSVSAVTVDVNGGGTAAQAAFNRAIVPHIHFDEDNDILLTGFNYGAITQGDTITATVANTQVIHRNRAGLTLYPADRCTWQQAYGAGRGYEINNARFFPGSGTTVSQVILNPSLGFIGKSGRFVEIAD